MNLGKIVYKVVFKPTLSIRYHIAHFGFMGWYRLAQGERQMKKQAKCLAPMPLAKDHLLEVNYLTGAKYWHQTIFCAQSLVKVVEGKVKINIYSDGTLTRNHKKFIKHALPGVMFISEEAIDLRLNQLLPISKYPTLHYLRNWHPFFKRLIDIHTSPSWAIHLDSDMLFFNSPKQIINAYQQKQAIYMYEHLNQSYFVDDEVSLKEKYDIHCLSHVNGGIVAYNSNIDYDNLEATAKTLLDHYPCAGPAQVEQTLMSYLLYQQQAEPLDKDQYIIFYNQDIDVNDSQIVRHYIFKAKQPYFAKEWKKKIR